MAQSTELAIVVKAKDEASATLKSIGDGLGKAMKTASIAAAAAGAAIGAFGIKAITEFSDVGDAVEKMAARTGLSAESVSALRVAADGAGTSIETVESAVKKMQLSIDTLNKTSPDTVYQLEAIGVSMKDLRAMSPEKQFETLGNAIAMVEDPAQRTQMAIAAFGKAGTDLIPLFEQGNFSMASWSERAKELGVSFTDLSASQAAQLNDAMGEMNTAMQGLQLQIATALVPVVIDLAKKLQPIIEKVVAWIQANPELVSKIAAVMAVVIPLLAILGPLTAAVTAVGAALAFVAANPIVLVIAAIVALIAAIVLIIKHWDQVKEFTMKIWAEITRALNQTWEDMKTAIGMAFEWIVTTITEFTDPIVAAWSAVWSAVKNVFDSIVEGIKAGITAAINFVIDKVNQAIGALNSVIAAMNKVPGVSIPSIPNVPRLAKGGIVTEPTLALIGEAGPEAVVPLSRGGGAGGFGGGATINISIGNFFGGDAERAARDLGDLIIKRLQLNARVG